MCNSAEIIWNNEVVGSVSNIKMDMWYLSGRWKRAHHPTALLFEKLASKLISHKVIKEPSNGMVARLRYDEKPDDLQYLLVLSVDKEEIFARITTEEMANYVSRTFEEPWTAVTDSDQYPKKLKTELNIFHPLKWKKLKALAIHSNQQEVVFEIPNSKSKFVVVRKNPDKETFRRFPHCRYFEDWKDLYLNYLFRKNKEIE